MPGSYYRDALKSVYFCHRITKPEDNRFRLRYHGGAAFYGRPAYYGTFAPLNTVALTPLWITSDLKRC
jgi:hypothetical protein